MFGIFAVFAHLTLSDSLIKAMQVKRPFLQLVPALVISHNGPALLHCTSLMLTYVVKKVQPSAAL